MTWKPHVTVAALIHQHNKFLLVEEIVDGQRVYNQPAGHLEPGETLEMAVIRETREETAWQFEPEYLTGIYQWDHPDKNKSFLRFCFAGQCLLHDENQTLDPDIEATAWLNLDEINQQSQHLRSPLVLRSIHDFLNGNRYPLDLLKGFI